MQNKAQFDDRIRNLLALAEDNSVESRTLLFSHICDLFIQDRPMESDSQIRMLVEILNELISDVDISIRKELSDILLEMAEPPAELVKIVSEDVIEVSGALLEQAIIEEEQLLLLIKFASDDHREKISQRFGLTPLLRRELNKIAREKEATDEELVNDGKKISLHELEEAQKNSTELTEDTTANILSLLRTNKKSSSINFEPVEIEESENKPHDNQKELPEEQSIPVPALSLTSRVFSKNKSTDPETGELNSETINIENDLEDAAPALVEEWFWEIDRNGNIGYLSDNTIDVFQKEPARMIGEDFLSLWQASAQDQDGQEDFLALFEKRLPFRGKTFQLGSTDGSSNSYILSAIATFDQETGRFTGFRGSAQIDEEAISIQNLLETKKLTSVDEVDSHLPHFSDNLEHDDQQSIQHEVDQVSSNDNQDEVASELLQNLSHEFRTPLNAIIGFSQMIDNEMWGPVSEKYRKNTKDIISAANQLKEAVNNILDSAKLEAGLIEPDPISFSLKSVIQESIDSIAPILESKELKVTGIDDNIDVILYNDKHCIMLCLIKIITYSIKNAELGSEFHVSVLVNSNAEVRIEIPLINEDINERDSDLIFQKMHDSGSSDVEKRTPNAEFEAKISSGFGLTVAQDIAELVGGELSTMAENGKITHIVFTISTYPI